MTCLVAARRFNFLGGSKEIVASLVAATRPGSKDCVPEHHYIMRSNRHPASSARAIPYTNDTFSTCYSLYERHFQHVLFLIRTTLSARAIPYTNDTFSTCYSLYERHFQHVLFLIRTTLSARAIPYTNDTFSTCYSLCERHFQHVLFLTNETFSTCCI